jgi:hypothetical protein
LSARSTESSPATYPFTRKNKQLIFKLRLFHIDVYDTNRRYSVIYYGALHRSQGLFVTILHNSHLAYFFSCKQKYVIQIRIKIFDYAVLTLMGPKMCKMQCLRQRIIIDSATLQSMQWIINAVYNQRSLPSTPLYTV